MKLRFRGFLPKNCPVILAIMLSMLCFFNQLSAQTLLTPGSDSKDKNIVRDEKGELQAPPKPSFANSELPQFQNKRASKSLFNSDETVIVGNNSHGVVWYRSKLYKDKEDGTFIAVGGSAKGYTDLQVSRKALQGDWKSESESPYVDSVPYIINRFLDIEDDGFFAIKFRPPKEETRFLITLIGEKKHASFLLIFGKDENQRLSMRRIHKTTHLKGIERYLTDDEVLDYTDWRAGKAFVTDESKKIEKKVEEQKDKRKKFFIDLGGGFAALTLDQETPDTNVSDFNFSETLFPFVSLDAQYFFRENWSFGLRYRGAQASAPSSNDFTVDSSEKIEFSEWAISTRIRPGKTMLKHFSFYFSLGQWTLPYIRRTAANSVQMGSDSSTTITIGARFWPVKWQRFELELQGHMIYFLSDGDEFKTAGAFGWDAHGLIGYKVSKYFSLYGKGFLLMMRRETQVFDPADGTDRDIDYSFITLGAEGGLRFRF